MQPISWRDLSAIITRDDLAAIARGTCAELGVASGAYSETLLARSDLSILYSIDRWSDHHDEAEMKVAADRLSKFGDRSRLVRATFADAVNAFPDESFDLIYIDGYAHTGQEGGETLRQWWPKLKPGGIFAGHDYHAVFPLTVEAVDRFMREHGLPFRLTHADQYPSWMTLKQ